MKHETKIHHDKINAFFRKCHNQGSGYNFLNNKFVRNMNN